MARRPGLRPRAGAAGRGSAARSRSGVRRASQPAVLGSRVSAASLVGERRFGLAGTRRGARRTTLGPLELAPAVRAQRPRRLRQAVARRADAMEPGPAVGTHQPVTLDAVTAHRAELVALHFGEQRLLGERALVDLGHRLAR